MQKVKIIMTFSFKECNHKYIYKEYRVVSLIRCHFFFPNGLGINVTCFLYMFTLLHNWISFCHGQILIETATRSYTCRRNHLVLMHLRSRGGGNGKICRPPPNIFFHWPPPTYFDFSPTPTCIFSWPPRIFFSGEHILICSQTTPHIFLFNFPQDFKWNSPYFFI